MKLNLGCGAAVDERPEVVNVDLHEYPGVNVVHDLDVHPWPWPSETFEFVQAIQLFEHVADPVGFMCDAWRVLEPGGILLITVPHFESRNSFTDPTHRRHCTEETFDYWIAGRPLNTQFGPAYAGPAVFSLGVVERYGDDIRAELVK